MSDAPAVLHLCSIKGRGGTGYMMSRLARLSADEGCCVVVGGCAGSKVEERAREAGLATLDGLHLRRGFHPLFLIQDLSKIRACLREEKIDIIHAWHSIEYWTAALAVRGTATKLVRTRGLVTPVKPSLVNRWIHNRTAFVHATCRNIAANYGQAGFDMNRVRLIYDGVDAERFNPAVNGAAIREECGIGNDAIVIGNIGRLETVKGQRYFLEALALLQAKRPQLDFHAVLAGDGSLRDELAALARERGIETRVHFLGVRNDIPEVMAACDMYVLSSIGSEGSSRATLEAMATGLPVVASSVGMLPDLVEENVTGFIVAPKGAVALADQIETLAMQPELRQSFGTTARTRVEAEYDERVFARRMVAAYREILKAGTP